MALTVGSRLGHYDVTALIGEGGMGQVYRATDTQLGRDVALKILPDAFAADPDRLARFQREAQVLASLNHPGIAAIYGIEKSDDTQALVLELVEGPTLADRIAKGPIPLDEALPIAKQIAEALEAAHEAGVIHRDLKPANIKVREDGTVKVLDFGLAKALDPNPEGDPSQSPTLTVAATKMGVILGTAAYMSPEQARGKPVDKRADIWAFGAVLFEMLTGAKPFPGDDVSQTLARVIDRDPDWDALSKTLPPALNTYMRRCLHKDPRQRVRDIGDMRLAMEGGFATTVSTLADQVVPLPQPARWRHALSLALGTLVVGGIITGLAVWGFTRPAPSPGRVMRFPIPLVEGDQFNLLIYHLVALSPDASHLVYGANGQLYLRPLAQMEATPILGTENMVPPPRNPFFSPDGLWIGFWGEGQLKRVSVSGGAPVTLTETPIPLGATWGDDDTILYATLDGVWQVPGTGGAAELLIPLDEGDAALSPQMLPGGEWVLVTIRPADVDDWDRAQIVVHSLVTGERRVLIDGGRDARYLPTGHLVYALGSAVLGHAFDLRRLEMQGGPVPLVDGVRNAATTTGASHFSVSPTGSLLYVPDDDLAARGGNAFFLCGVRDE